MRRLRAAGAIVVGKTKMPELGLWPFTESITWGVTRNPWDTDRTPGGSSGGSAAAVAAGLVPAAVAADGAGSIRIPAACCGLFGLKPHSGPRAARAARRRRQPLGLLRRAHALGRGLGADVRRDGAGHRARGAAAAADRLLARRSRRSRAGKLDATTSARALRDTAALLNDLGHTVVERDTDLRARDMPVIVALLLRGIRDIVRRSSARSGSSAARATSRRPGALVTRPTRRTAARRRAADRARASAGCGTTFDVLLMPIMSAPAARRR